MVILIKTGQLLLSLSILVILHEFGHFAFARLFKTRVEKFYLFFNPWFSLFKTKWGETEYGIGWLPLGGYVKISGMIDESMDTEQMKQEPQPWEFRTKKAWQRLLIMLGGVLVNFILAFLIYAMVLNIWGREYLPTKNVKYGIMVDSVGYELGLRNGDKIISLDGEEVDEFKNVFKTIIFDDTKVIKLERNGEIKDIKLNEQAKEKIISSQSRLFTLRMPFYVGGFAKESPAKEAGLQIGDKIIGINDKHLEFFDEFVDEIQDHKNQKIAILILRNGEEQAIDVKTTENGKIGVANGFDIANEFGITQLKYSPFEAVLASFPLGYELIKDQLKQLKLIPKNADKLGGFIAIGNIFPSKWDWEKFWLLTTMLSVMLAVLNLLPIPGLDGGHVMFLLYEMITGRQPSEKFMINAQTVGFILLLTLILYVNGNDIFKLIVK